MMFNFISFYCILNAIQASGAIAAVNGFQAFPYNAPAS